MLQLLVCQRPVHVDARLNARYLTWLAGMPPTTDLQAGAHTALLLQLVYDVMFSSKSATRRTVSHITTAIETRRLERNSAAHRFKTRLVARENVREGSMLAIRQSVGGRIGWTLQDD
jgi:hypothetical protein